MPDGTTINVSYGAERHGIATNLLSASIRPVSSTTWLVDTNNLTGYAQGLEELRQIVYLKYGSWHAGVCKNVVIDRGVIFRCVVRSVVDASAPTTGLPVVDEVAVRGREAMIRAVVASSTV